MIEKLLLTALLFSGVFLVVIKLHGEDKPERWIMYVETLGLLFSLASCVVLALISIWVN